MPLVWGVFQPIAPTHDFASPMLNLRVPRFLYRRSHELMNRLMWLSWQMHGLGADGGLARINQQPAFFAFSRQLVAPWSDMAPHHAITGWLGGSIVRPPASVALQRFLDDPAPFVMATFGTPAANESATLYDVVIAACQQRGARLLLQVPAHLTSMAVPEGFLLVTDDVDHQQVFARASVVIHHGGAGTTHACLATGVPMIIVPRGIDQFDWAMRVYNAQLTPAIIGRNELRVQALADVIAHTDRDVRYRQRVRTVQQGELAVSGVAGATDIIRQYI
jgi:UDP:flavonoid glycosyltransferase YjiC (YdhE family)